MSVGIREIKKALEQRWSRRQNPLHEDAASTALIADELAHLVRSMKPRASAGVDAKGCPRSLVQPSPRWMSSTQDLLSSMVTLGQSHASASRLPPRHWAHDFT